MNADVKPWWHYQPIVLSATQLDTFELCQRKWAWKHIEGLSGTNVFAQKGIQIDDALTNWLEKGVAIDGASDIGKIVMPGLKHLPLPGTPSLQVQREFKLGTEVATYYGKKDFEWFDEESGLPVVGDNKSTVDFKWAKTEQDLRENTQAILYAAEAVEHFKTDSVELRWVYYRTRGTPASKVTKLKMLRSELEERMDHIDETAKKVIEAYKAMPDATDLPINPGACEAFGGCPYRENCKLSSLQRMKALMTQESKGQSLIERMRARSNADRQTELPFTPPPPTPPSPPAVASNGAAEAKVSSLAEKMAARKAQGVNPPPVEQAVSHSPMPPSAPPAAAKPEPVAATVDAETAADGPKRGRPKKVETAANGAASASSDAASHMATIAAAASELRKLGYGVSVKYDF